ncbi:ribosomal protein S18-alanine N-acetyltransferase [Pseudochrobactrum algeriensis]|uniref:Ribosomal-protein-alanine N-acetyltransferase n=1 Tax=Pseudochrobactrum saccharolyticum TaxID=354352 RepID=A0A7W8AJD0_9HYPH|nr:ribosomal protein S18-alanine N-acetyltransferase [Pseudochrobactrum saccharolyticum]QVQ36852.1 ribosomal protein S18-alanine N-acetyltransferase [Pseudochrobactrum algeriensis]KAB0540783.1 ribosomal-protein-alanine N-acetyltransferase [Pseudochrobactrum saccharolyticum]MBB5090370.1 ribosomal-protein-alanine N-acetyltransferase [Pseudochrobactrum saccharolyticum]MDP8252272.1 ribosomal protein S18-alanine N-acetyltransferase [Pseudochrobactrum saccharolyticum]QVQ40068.1 ribosomal protein S18
MIGLPFSRQSFAYEALIQAHCAELADLHAPAFHHAWSEEDFAGMLSQGNIFGFIARPVGKPKQAAGFVLARLVAGEAEILTIAVSSAFQRRGIGRDLMEAVLRHLHHERAESLFLEVDESNVAAQALYRRLGFIQVGQRPAYYETGHGRSNALVLRRQFPEAMSVS